MTWLAHKSRKIVPIEDVSTSAGRTVQRFFVFARHQDDVLTTAIRLASRHLGYVTPHQSFVLSAQPLVLLLDPCPLHPSIQLPPVAGLKPQFLTAL